MLIDYRHISVPKGWKDTTLGKVADVVGGGTPSTENPAYWGGSVPWATPTDVTRLVSRFIGSTGTTLTDEGLKESAATLLPVNSVLMTSRATIGACAINIVPMATNQGFASLVCRDGLAPEFLYYLMSARSRELTRLACGSTFVELAKSELKKLRVLCPPAAEQGKIVGILTAVDSAIEGTRDVIAQTRRLKQALLQDLLTHGLPGRRRRTKPLRGVQSCPAAWPVEHLGTVLTELRYGTSRQLSGGPEQTPVLRIPNVVSGEINTLDLKYADLGTELSELTLVPGDLLFVRTNGNPEYVGRCAVVEGLEGTWAYASYLIRARCNRERLLPAFLHAFLSSSGGRAELIGGIRTSAGNYNLNTQTIRAVRIPLPSLEEQREIVGAIEAVCKTICEAARHCEQLDTAKSALSQALLVGVGMTSRTSTTIRR